MHTEFQNYLCFTWESCYYRWQILPLGWRPATAASAPASSFNESARGDLCRPDLHGPSRAIIHQHDRVVSLLQSMVTSLTLTSHHWNWNPIICTLALWSRQLTLMATSGWVFHGHICMVLMDTKRAKTKGRLSPCNACTHCRPVHSMSKPTMPARLLLQNIYGLLCMCSSWQDTLVLDTATIQDFD